MATDNFQMTLIDVSLIFAQNIDYGLLLELSHLKAVQLSANNLCFRTK